MGAVLRVDFAPGWHTYALTLTDAEFAFFDAATQAELPAEEAVRRPVLFRWCINNDAVTSGRWPRVGKAPVPAGLAASIPKATALRDGIYQNGVIRPATPEECEGLEPAAVWEPEHAEARLRRHYAGFLSGAVKPAEPGVPSGRDGVKASRSSRSPRRRGR